MTNLKEVKDRVFIKTQYNLEVASRVLAATTDCLELDLLVEEAAQEYRNSSVVTNSFMTPIMVHLEEYSKFCDSLTSKEYSSDKEVALEKELHDNISLILKVYLQKAALGTLLDGLKHKLLKKPVKPNLTVA